MIPTLVKSALPTLIVTLVGRTSLTLVHHIEEGLDNIQSFLKSKKFDSWTEWLPTMKIKGRERMFGLGKPRSRFGKFLDKNGISQQDVVRESGVNRGTISRICQGNAFQPSLKNGNKIIKALRRLTNKDVHYDDFWM